MQYITQKKTKGCVFCRIFREKKDKKNFVILRSSHCFAVLNIFPYNNGHTMVVTNRHVKSLEDLKEEELLDISKTLVKVESTLKKTLSPEGFNIGMNIGKLAGAGIEKHIHIHIVPRWLGDTNFMPVIADTKTIPQSLGRLYKQIKKTLAQAAAR